MKLKMAITAILLLFAGVAALALCKHLEIDCNILIKQYVGLLTMGLLGG